MSFSLSRYPDAVKVTEDLKRLVSLPVRLPESAYQKEVDAYFDEKCTRSREMIEKAGTRIPGGVQHNLAFNHPFPLVIDRAEGAYLYDLGRQPLNIDFLQAGGPTLLGSNMPEVREKVIDLLNTTGPVTGAFP